MTTEFRHIRDFIIMHYHLTDRTDTEFWRRNSAMDIPEPLAHRLALFEQSGNVFRGSGTRLWRKQLDAGHDGRIRPAHYHPIVHDVG